MTKLVFKRNTDEGFPQNLKIIPTGDVPLRDYDKWYSKFNDAVDDWNDGLARRNERAVLDLVQAIESLCNSGHEPDPFLGEYIMLPLVQAFDNLLNHDVGRLDPGRSELQAHVYERVRMFGIDPETGELVKS